LRHIKRTDEVLLSPSDLEELWMSVFGKFLRDESGATAIEYGLIAALISVVIIGAVQLVGTNLGNTFNTVAQNLGGAAAK
jgi:pilus assembly protein Flp/PilA